MSDNKQIEICSFCNTHKDQRKKLIVSGDVAICDYCLNLCHELIVQDIKPEDDDTLDMADSLNKIDALDISKHLDEHVIGQEEAKKVLSVA